jgi:hypothetical protein
VRISDLSEHAAKLDGVRERTNEGLAQWRYRGRLVARQLDDDHVVVRTAFDDRDALVSFPEMFSVPKRFAKHMMVVADLRHGQRNAIEDAVTAAWELQRASVGRA